MILQTWELYDVVLIIWLLQTSFICVVQSIQGMLAL